MRGFFKLLFPDVALISKHSPIAPRKRTEWHTSTFFRMNVNLRIYTGPIEVNEVILCVPAHWEGR